MHLNKIHEKFHTSTPIKSIRKEISSQYKYLTRAFYETFHGIKQWFFAFASTAYITAGGNYIEYKKAIFTKEEFLSSLGPTISPLIQLAGACFLILFFIHRIRAPLLIENEELKIAENNADKNYECAHQIGLLFDLVENWSKKGAFGGYENPIPEACKAYYKLKNFSFTLNSNDQKKMEFGKKLKKFLTYFENEIIGTIEGTPICEIKTIFKSQSEAETALPEVDELAKYLTDNIDN